MVYPRKVQQLIKYGIREANKQPTAAHNRDKPGPLETSIPKGILVVFRINPFTDSELLMAEVQSAAPVKTKVDAMIARQADVRKAKVRLKTPITSAKNAQIVPTSIR
jgi:hypothetical protein